MRFMRLRPGTKFPADPAWQKNPLPFEAVNPRACGVHVGASGLLVVDEDGPEGTVTAWAATRGETLPETLTVRTASGKLHRYYLLPPGVGYVRSRVTIDGRRVDLLAGSRYAVAPGTVIYPYTDRDGVDHPGGVYVVESDRPMVTAPDWLVALVTALDGGPGVAGTREDVGALLADLEAPDGPMCAALATVVDRQVERIEAAGPHCHGEGVQAAYAVAMFGARGHRGAQTAMREVQAAFLDVRYPSGPESAESEWDGRNGAIEPTAWAKASTLDRPSSCSSAASSSPRR